ncbi:MAG: hypothetical protein P4L76_08780 [Beijerinckiaceae bacterium]|nr:hypothetical protein [Beijerinckiaceae bacterium]
MAYALSQPFHLENSMVAAGQDGPSNTRISRRRRDEVDRAEHRLGFVARHFAPAAARLLRLKDLKQQSDKKPFTAVPVT